MPWLGTAVYQSHTCTHIIAVALGFWLYGLLKIKLWPAYCSEGCLVMSDCLLFNSCLSFLSCFLCRSTWPVITEKSLGERPKASVREVMFVGMSLKSVSFHLSLPQDTPAIKEILHSWAFNPSVMLHTASLCQLSQFFTHSHTRHFILSLWLFVQGEQTSILHLGATHWQWVVTSFFSFHASKSNPCLEWAAKSASEDSVHSSAWGVLHPPLLSPW